MKRLTTAVIALTLSTAAYAADQENEDSIVVPPVTITAPRFEQIETAPMRVEMTINVEARGFTVGEGKDVFEHDGDVYRVVSEARTSGIVRAVKRIEEKRESRGEVTGQGIRPTSFRQERTGKSPKNASFDWDAGKLTLSEGEEREVVALPPATLDQTSLPYAFVFVQPPRSGQFRVNVTDGRRLTAYDVRFVGQERLDTKLGKIDTLRYRKVQTGDDKRGFEFWLSLQHHNLPVRIRIVEKDGTAFDSNVTRLEFTRR